MPTAKHKQLREDLIAALGKHEDVPGEEMLAVTSYLVGQIIAWQDQRKITPAQAIELVQMNIAQGNQDALSELLGPAKGRA
ncbi:MAG: hypothetical protein ACP5DX_03990 [Paracoccaceae bacterium]